LSQGRASAQPDHVTLEPVAAQQRTEEQPRDKS
jgi:hypothetical protein